MRRALSVSGGTLAVADEGPAGTARSVVLLHGFTGSAASFAGLRRALRRRCRVLAVDLPGHGATRMDARRFAWSLAATADAVVAGLDALGIGRAAVLGYSMGGRVALQLALAHGARVERLVLESASAGLATAPARQRRRRADAALAHALERDGIAAFVRRWEAQPLFRSLAALPAAARRALRRERLARDPAGLAASLRGMGTGAQPWLGARAATLAMPVLLVTGALDDEFTRLARALARRIPRARLAIVPGAGHVPHLEQPARFLAHVREFLDADPRHRIRPQQRACKEDGHGDHLAHGA